MTYRAPAPPLPAATARPVVLHARVVTGTGGGPEKTILNTPRFLRPLGYDAVCAYLQHPADPGCRTDLAPIGEFLADAAVAVAPAVQPENRLDL